MKSVKGDIIIIKYLSGSRANEFSVFPIEKCTELFIGRIDKVDIYFEDSIVSRLHARIVRDSIAPLTFSIENLRCRYGTYINNQKITGKVELKTGDLIQFGKVELKTGDLIQFGKANEYEGPIVRFVLNIEQPKAVQTARTTTDSLKKKTSGPLRQKRLTDELSSGMESPKDTGSLKQRTRRNTPPAIKQEPVIPPEAPEHFEPIPQAENRRQPDSLPPLFNEQTDYPTHNPEEADPVYSRARSWYIHLIQGNITSPEPIYLNVDASSRPADLIEDRQVFLQEVFNNQGSFVLFASEQDKGRVFPNPLLSFRPLALRPVFPELTEERFNLHKEIVEPARVLRMPDGRWKIECL